MRVISNAALKAFWTSRRGDADRAEKALRGWERMVRGCEATDFAALKRSFRSVDRVGNCIVFNVGGNHYRLIGRINFRRQVLFVLRIMDHAECDRTDWSDESGCFTPPPERTTDDRPGGQRSGDDPALPPDPHRG